MALLTSIVPPSNLVIGATASTDNAVVRFDGATGKIIQNSNVTIADDGTTVISVNSSTAALRITQTGAGNALVVEDSTNPDSTPFVISSSGNVIVGSTTFVNSGQINKQIENVGIIGNEGFAAASYINDQFSAPSIAIGKSRGATVGDYTIVQSGDRLGGLSCNGSDGSAFVTAASVRAEVDGTPGTNDMPGRLIFGTTADGGSAPTERMRIDSAGVVTISNSLVVGSTDIITELNTKTSTGKAIAMAIVFG